MKNQYGNRRDAPVAAPIVEVDQQETPSTEEKAEVIGIVTDCIKLNLREDPDPDAAVLTVIPAMTEVAVDMEASTDSFYKVCTPAGLEGFCMRKYIAVRK